MKYNICFKRRMPGLPGMTGKGLSFSSISFAAGFHNPEILFYFFRERCRVWPGMTAKSSSFTSIVLRLKLLIRRIGKWKTSPMSPRVLVPDRDPERPGVFLTQLTVNDLLVSLIFAAL